MEVILAVLFLTILSTEMETKVVDSRDIYVSVETGSDSFYGSAVTVGCGSVGPSATTWPNSPMNKRQNCNHTPGRFLLKKMPFYVPQNLRTLLT